MCLHAIGLKYCLHVFVIYITVLLQFTLVDGLCLYSWLVLNCWLIS